jgi:hypothetical protein
LRRSINFIKIPSQTDHEEEKRHSEGWDHTVKSTVIKRWCGNVWTSLCL